MGTLWTGEAPTMDELKETLLKAKLAVWGQRSEAAESRDAFKRYLANIGGQATPNTEGAENENPGLFHDES